MILKKSFMLLLMMTVLVALAACGSSQSNGGGSGDGENASEFKLVEPGKFTFAASGEFKPFSFMKDGKMVGYDIAVGQAIAEKLGLEPNQQKVKFSGIVSGVQHHRYDAAVASHTITPERKEHVNFSQPYYYSGPQIFTRPGSEIETAEDLKDKEICVSRGSTYVKIAKKYTDNISLVDSDVVALQGLAKGHYDVVITDAITGQKAINSGVKIEGKQVLGQSKQAVAVPKDRPKLLEAINEALTELKESGELKEISMQWIHKDITKPLNENQ
ncbi:MAG TPA: transporter substrate-binding domain-containing protein [Bacillales bacterium]|nr:transporter substrate-binding domain-containing protein [Bacillales bacterium]